MSKPNDPQSIGQIAQPLAAQAQQAGQTPPTEGAYKDNFGKFVRQGATYTHVIRFANSPKTTLIGYSRPRGGREKEDKVVLLQDIIRRLLASPKAYLQAGACIEFYNNLSDDDRDSVWIFTLHQGRAEPSHSASQLPWLMAYLEGLYKPNAYVQDLFTPNTGGRTPYPQTATLTPAIPRLDSPPQRQPAFNRHTVFGARPESAPLRIAPVYRPPGPGRVPGPLHSGGGAAHRRDRRLQVAGHPPAATAR